VGGNSLSKSSRVAGLSGGTIRRAGGTGLGQPCGGEGVAQPPSKVAPAAIGSIQFPLQPTLHLLMTGVFAL